MRQNRPETSAALLAWYDIHRRSLPWRAEPGQKPDPYRVWISEIMLQQTTVAAVVPYYARFLDRFPDLDALASADIDAVLGVWAGLGYYARGRNLHACAKAVRERHAGRLPATEAELRALPGIGPYTAAAIAAIAFGQRAAPVDGNITRIIARLFALDAPLPGARRDIQYLAETMTPAGRAGDFAQAMMDLGATICTPKRPACALCPLAPGCAARAAGNPANYPLKAPKRQPVLRRGAAFVVLRGADVLVRTRPRRGLLGGMTEVPTTEWTADFDGATALAHAPVLRLGRRARGEWRRPPGLVTHVFTHFRLELTVLVTRVPAQTPAPAGMYFLSLDDLAAAALPTLMRKVIAHATGAGEDMSAADFLLPGACATTAGE